MLYSGGLKTTLHSITLNNMKENKKVELNLKDMENVSGGGVITGFFNPYSVPGRNPKNGKSGNERKDN